MINNDKTDQIYDNGILLGALLQITGLSIWEVQSILRGDIRLKTTGKNIRSLIIDGAELKQSFTIKTLEHGISIEDLNSAFSTNITDDEYKSNIYNPNFLFNGFNFSLKSSTKIRQNLVKIFKEKYNFSNQKTADLLDISATTVAKILGESKTNTSND